MTGARARLLAGTICVLMVATVNLAQAKTAAGAGNDHDALVWLKRIYHATQTLSYTGIFIYQQGNHTRASHIVHQVVGGKVTEKINALDGMPRETLRTRNMVECYFPALHVVKIDRHGKRRGFPAMLPDQLGSLPYHYVIRVAGKARVAGRECQEIVLKPRDAFRYGYRLWADKKTGMLLKARTFNEKGERVEQFAFTEIRYGQVLAHAVQPDRVPHGWRVEESTVTPINLATTGWQVNPRLPGFRRIAEVRRKLNDSHLVDQVVFSDGMTAVSVFIGLSPEKAPVQTGLSSAGAVNIYTREVAHHLVTVVGEAPTRSVQRIGDSVEYHPTQR